MIVSVLALHVGDGSGVFIKEIAQTDKGVGHIWRLKLNGGGVEYVRA